MPSVMPAKRDVEHVAALPFTHGDRHYQAGDDWDGPAEATEGLLAPVDGPNGSRPPLLRKKTRRSPSADQEN